MEHLSPLIKPQELLSLHNNKESFVLIDATNAGKAKYLESHLDGALYVDMDTQLADVKPDAANGGRHPLPTPTQFSETLTQLGISPQSHVIIYDHKNASNAAARCWWMLKAAGHQNVQVLDGGAQAAEAIGFPVSTTIENPVITKPYQFTEWQLPLADISLVEKASHDANYLIIDVRDEERFWGEKEPIDLVAGHIPNATNIPFISNLDENGFYKSPDQLKAKYEEALKTKKTENVIIHCGSGVTACHTLLAIAAAGMEIPRLYVGSWSEWSRNDKPMITKK